MSEARYLLGALSVATILGLSAQGACNGMGKCGTASVLYSNIPIIVTYSYVAMIMISTVFFYGFILSIVIINKIGKSYTIFNGVSHLSASFIFGMIGLNSGQMMGNISKMCFKEISVKPDFYTTFIISLASVEVTVVIGFLCTLLILHKS